MLNLFFISVKNLFHTTLYLIHIEKKSIKLNSDVVLFCFIIFVNASQIEWLVLLLWYINFSENINHKTLILWLNNLFNRNNNKN